jgi:hypothetical protein
MAYTTKIIFNSILNLLFLVISYILVQAYVAGDQLSYRAYYDAIGQFDFFDALLAAKAYIDAIEPLTIFLLWVGSTLDIDKDFYITLFNFILFLLFGEYLKSHNCSFIVRSLIYSNFYFLVLLTSAERLKFFYILILLLYTYRISKIGLWIILLPLTHLQAILYLPSLYLINIREYSFYLFDVRKVFVQTIFISILIYFIIANFEHFTHKFNSYSNESIFEITQFFAILSLVIIILKKWRPILALIPLFPMILIVGSSRMNMILFTIFCHLIIINGKSNNPLFIISLVYLSVKSVFFVNNIFVYGNGFEYLPF